MSATKLLAEEVSMAIGEEGSITDLVMHVSAFVCMRAELDRWRKEDLTSDNKTFVELCKTALKDVLEGKLNVGNSKEMSPD